MTSIWYLSVYFERKAYIKNAYHVLNKNKLKSIKTPLASIEDVRRTTSYTSVRGAVVSFSSPFLFSINEDHLDDFQCHFVHMVEITGFIFILLFPLSYYYSSNLIVWLL